MWCSLVQSCASVKKSSKSSCQSERARLDACPAWISFCINSSPRLSFTIDSRRRLRTLRERPCGLARCSWIFIHFSDVAPCALSFNMSTISGHWLMNIHRSVMLSRQNPKRTPDSVSASVQHHSKTLPLRHHIAYALDDKAQSSRIHITTCAWWRWI